jgi:6-methylsalicylate decarboxylase
MRIDVHSHYYDTELLRAMAELGSDFYKTVVRTPNAAVDVPQRIRLLDDAAIDMQIISPGGLQPYLAEESRAVSGAELINNLYRAVVADHPRRLAAFGCVPLPHVAAAIATAGHCFDELGFLGINLGCAVGDRPLDEPEFEPLWAELDRRAAVVFLHPLGAGGPNMDAFGLEWAIGGRFEDTVAAVRLVSSGITYRYPNVKIIVPHLGGTIPFLWDRFRDRPNATGEIFNVKEGLKRLFYDSINLAPGMLCSACQIVGADRVVMGTDFPWSSADLTVYVRAVEESGLSAAAAEAILDQNASRVLGLA